MNAVRFAFEAAALSVVIYTLGKAGHDLFALAADRVLNWLVPPGPPPGPPSPPA